MSDTETPRLAGIFSIASGLVHGVAAGLHADHAAAARSFAVLAIVQVVAGLAGLFSGDQRVRILVAGANVVSIGGWIAAKTVGIGFINGLETVEGVQATDLLCAILAAIAVSFAVAPQLAVNLNLERLSATGLAVILTVPAMVTAAGHDHGSSASDWPRPYFPGIGIDIEGVDGVTAEQEARARQLVLDALFDVRADLGVLAAAEGAEREGTGHAPRRRTGYQFGGEGHHADHRELERPDGDDQRREHRPQHLGLQRLHGHAQGFEEYGCRKTSHR